MKRPYQPNRRKRVKNTGFLSRMATTEGRKVLSKRRAKGRHQIIVPQAGKGKQI